MRDPELVVRAQLAASALEGAWRRWRVVHSDMADPMPAVSSYVGYSLQEPWGQPRVVFGLAAQDAERLAALIERHDCGGLAYAAATQAGVRDLAAWTSARTVPAPAPRQEPLAAANKRIGQPLADAPDEPVYRQAAAAMKEAVAARENASRVRPEVVSPAWMGALAKAASTAKAEAEARIRATLTDPDDESTGTSESEADAGDLAVDPGEEDGRSPLPQIYATDVLEPLATPEVADGADVAAVEDPAEAPSHDDQGEDEDVSDDIPEQDDPEVAASVQSGGAGVGADAAG